MNDTILVSENKDTIFNSNEEARCYFLTIIINNILENLRNDKCDGTFRYAERAIDDLPVVTLKNGTPITFSKDDFLAMHLEDGCDCDCKLIILLPLVIQMYKDIIRCKYLKSTGDSVCEMK